MKQILILLCLIVTIPIKTYTAPGDTLHVQAFTFGSPQNAWFQFPSDTIRFRKILMNYKLKCNSAQSPACGEWDYQTSTYVYEHTGLLDSNLLNTNNYVVNGASPDSFSFMRHPSWTFSPHFNTQINYASVISFDSAQLGSGITSTQTAFNSQFPEGRSQYLWKAQELSAAGLQAGNITGLRFQLQANGSELKNLMIRFRKSSLDSLTSTSFVNDSLVTVFFNNTGFNGAGWQSVHFITPFYWDGISNIVVDISFDNESPGTPSIVFAENTGIKTGIWSAGSDKSLFFKGSDCVNVPATAFSSIDSNISVSFWQYGNPPFQPQNQSCFEGADSLGHRVVNAHVPWSDANVYWDAGNTFSSSYDRINKLANPQDYKGQWNHWAFVKEVASGTMKIFLNGKPWAQGTGKTRTMAGIKTFRIGSAWNGTNNYDGNIDEFQVWDMALDSASINQWMYRDLNASHPFYSHLKTYYKFDDNSMSLAADSSGNNHMASLFGLPVYKFIPGNQLIRNFHETSLRPNVIFEQGVYTSVIDTIISIDSTENDPVQIVMYGDSLHPLVPTDTLTVWPVGYKHYVYNNSGIAVDSAFMPPDSTIYLRKWYYYCTPFLVVNRYELERLITPYGNGLSLGNGFTWVFDVSDYRTLLHDSVNLSAGNWQELLDLSFDFIIGIPPRDPISVKNLWSGNYRYNTNTPSLLLPKEIRIDTASLNTRIKIRPTGHGFGGNENCSEFCPKHHMILVNGTQRYSHLVWRDNCSLNPIYPQGGTWVYSRSNWCPGGEAYTYDFELTPWVTPGDSASIGYAIDPYTWNGQGSWPYYEIETQVISYRKANFLLDAELYEIITPSRADLYKRMNPICDNPVVTIRNSGATTLTSLDILYGVEGNGLSPATYHWTGNLKSMEMDTIQLGQVPWGYTGQTFYATVSAPNGGADMYPGNNTIRSKFTYTPQYPSSVIVEFRTNNWSWEDSYVFRDQQGNIIFQKNNLNPNTTYFDTVNFTNGCYEFRLTDTGQDGLSFWANPDQGSGYVWFRDGATGSSFKIFGVDFGQELYQQFTVGYALNIKEPENHDAMVVYPNPSKGDFNLRLVLQKESDVVVSIYDHMGRLVLRRDEGRVREKTLRLDLSMQPAGFYTLSCLTSSGLTVRKLIINR